MKRILFSLFLGLGAISLFAQANDDRVKELAAAAKKTAETGWSRGGALGFDLGGLGIANPRAGAALNRFGIGAVGTYFADKKMEKSYWDNSGSLQLGILRQGGKDEPFLKNIDLIRLTSKFGRSISQNEKWYLSGLAIGTTTFLTTYEGNYLKEGTGAEKRNLFSKLFAPATLQFHPGIEWKPNEHFNVLFSPIGMSLIYVGNDPIAQLNIHGNEVGKNNRLQLVPAIQVGYKNKFFNDRVIYTSSLNWTTNYLDRPFAISALNFWQNNASIALFKGLSLDLFGEAAYDHYKLIQKDVNKDGKFTPGDAVPANDRNGIPAYNGVDYYARGVQWVGSFMLKYNRIL